MMGISALALVILAADASKNRLHTKHVLSEGRGLPPYTELTTSGDRSTAVQRVPCHQPRSKDESDLCAQYWAATAAFDNAYWARWQVIIGLLTSIGLGITIVLTLRSLRASELTLAHAQAVSTAQLRAYVTTAVTLEAGPDRQYRVITKMKNVGQTPARFVHWRAFAKIVPYPLRQTDIPETLKIPRPSGALPPGAEARKITRIDLSSEQLQNIKDGTACIIYRRDLRFSILTGAAIKTKGLVMIMTRSEIDAGEFRNINSSRDFMKGKSA